MTTIMALPPLTSVISYSTIQPFIHTTTLRPEQPSFNPLSKKREHKKTESIMNTAVMLISVVGPERFFLAMLLPGLAPSVLALSRALSIYGPFA
ncbi:hypothetical protein [Anoxynatronum sibiricum]|uniref:Uncharacterized protein n=1 Tax=Anoxynatronum sibiricum TaxID=210623 RepID=A0ABU9VUN1_9CLOT